MRDVHVPVIDVAPFLAGDAAASRALAREVDVACREIGFLTVVGHAVPETLIEEARDAALGFFRLPLGEKLRTPRPSHESGRGYTVFGDQALAYSLGVETPPDLQESFGIGPLDAPPDDPYYAAPEAWTFFAPNIWPSAPIEFRPALSRYFAKIDILSRRLMGLFALALGLDERYFDDKVDRPVSSMRAVHYPPLRATPQPGQLRAGAHSDYGSLTILQTDDDPGCLQVKTRRGDWIDVFPPPGAFVVNLGDLMSRWTNERWISTLHRVAIPPDGRDGSRLSLVFFGQPNYDAVIECLPTCRGPDNPPRHPPISTVELSRSKHMKVRYKDVGYEAARP
ncbi:MAG: isopenicillin N synthase family oxygenase [Alphaproteobacteria bacterium]|nr:isopenicillin N synthase family oxygenase [Alphaproteobacteria bacterium]MCY4498072.1 isopenicillin N synthase family oxygenase [Rhodospirillaceae bacterium]